MTPLECAILRAITWFDLWHYPLTAFECWQYLYQEGEYLGTVTPWEVRVALARLTERGVLRVTNGFWRLASAPPHLSERQQRARWSIGKHQRARAGARLIASLPFVRLVALGNSVAFSAPRTAESDIDLLIVVQPGRLFLARLWVTLAVHLCGWRRHGTKVRDRLCLSFYLDQNSLALQPFAYPDDPYLKFWLATLAPLLDSGTYRRLLSANSWVADSLSNLGFQAESYVASATAVPAGSRFVQRALEVLFSGGFGNWCEYLSARLQLPRMRRYVGEHLGDGTGDVAVSAQVIKMHLSDRRREFARAFRQKLEAVTPAARG